MCGKLLKNFFLLCLITAQPHLHAGNAQSDNDWDNELADADNGKSQHKVEPSPDVAPSTKVRRFQTVLDELLAEFGYDVKLGQLKELKNLAIRRVEVSDALPDTYRDYLKFLAAERIRDNANVPILNCIPCTSRTSKMVEGKIVITSPITDANELRTAAERLGIENFMDIILIYHTTHMVLAVQIFKNSTNELVWTRTYNSETIKSRYQKLAIDYSQVAKSRVSDEYKPDYRLLIGLGGAYIPNLSGSTNDNTMLSLQFRGTERFDHRRTEFGMLLSIQATLSKLMANYPTTGAAVDLPNTKAAAPTEPAPYKYSLGLYALYAHNFLGVVESYDQIRQGITLGLGATLAMSYLAPTARIGWDMYFGRRFVVSVSGIYVAPSKILVDGTFVSTTGGPGADVIISLNY